MAETTTRAGFVYLIGQVDGCYKIGRSKSPDVRHAQLDCLPVPLEVRARIASKNPHWLERSLHRAFKARRVRREWFRLTAEEVVLLAGLKRVDSADDLPSVLLAPDIEMDITADMPGRDTVPGLAARLRAAREAAGLSQVQAGEKAGVHHVSIAMFETDKRAPTVKVLLKLADAYGIDVCDLIPRTRRKR